MDLQVRFIQIYSVVHENVLTGTGIYKYHHLLLHFGGRQAKALGCLQLSRQLCEFVTNYKSMFKLLACLYSCRIALSFLEHDTAETALKKSSIFRHAHGQASHHPRPEQVFNILHVCPKSYGAHGS